jgi:two-component system sensor histidine kinase ChvG
MASATVIAEAERTLPISLPTTTADVDAKAERRRFSPITRRVLAVNVLALLILVGGLLFLGQYRKSLIQAELSALELQAEMFAAAIGEVSVTADDVDRQDLIAEVARRIVRRMVETTDTRARLYRLDGTMIADSWQLVGPGGTVTIEELPPPGESKSALSRALELYYRLLNRLFGLEELPPYEESASPWAGDYEEVVVALSGDNASAVRSAGESGLVLSVAVPVQRYKRVVGALMLSKGSWAVDAAMYRVRLDILKMFGVALAVTVLLSLYLASTIARPIRKLAAAAEQVRGGVHRPHKIPDFGKRNDEISELAVSLRDMTEALWRRMDATERFAADVAHEIKNPLTSLQSAVETATRVKDDAQKQRLMQIIADDVRRLDRLISEISAASRLDAELSRAKTAPVRIDSMLQTLADVHDATRVGQGPKLELAHINGEPLTVNGMEGRLVQVLRNLITNAVSFSPPGGTIVLDAERQGRNIVVTVEDEGPGIPEGKEQTIFERFYSERPEGEKFGTHSGLGLSISMQIVEAHGGTIRAENRRGPDGRVRGARFVVSLPAA